MATSHRDCPNDDAPCSGLAPVPPLTFGQSHTPHHPTVRVGEPVTGSKEGEMPRERIYTGVGYVEVQWAKAGQHMCFVSSDGQEETMHQFSFLDEDQARSLASTLRRAVRQSYQTA